MFPFADVVLLAGILLVFSLLSYKKRALDFKGVLMADAVGTIIFVLGGIEKFLLVVFVFVAVEACTRLGKTRKIAHETRTIGNILGNSGAAVLALLFRADFAFFGALAAALADTLSSEIGMLSRKKPKLITTFETVEHGTDGGVTALGMYAAIFGASLIAVAHYFLNLSLPAAAILIIAGFLGSIADSVFGAIFERRGMMNNAQVNFLGSLAGAAIAHALAAALL